MGIAGVPPAVFRVPRKSPNFSRNFRQGPAFIPLCKHSVRVKVRLAGHPVDDRLFYFTAHNSSPGPVFIHI
jgi:hypothetical protein